MSGPTFSLLSLQEGNNNVAAAKTTAATLIVCVSLFTSQMFLVSLGENRQSIGCLAEADGS
jgi:hypothetical protein